MGAIGRHDVPRHHDPRPAPPGPRHARTCREVGAGADRRDRVLGDGFLFILLQIFTAGILVLAANTAFQDFPRLASILARDRFMPSQFRNRGDRLVFSNGVVILAGLACLLIYVYDAELTRLIQLYVVGVFTAFTLSQAGMVRRWFRLRGAGGAERRHQRDRRLHDRHRAHHRHDHEVPEGAKIVIAAMPIIVLLFLAVHRHYEHVGRLLRGRGLTADREAANSSSCSCATSGRRRSTPSGTCGASVRRASCTALRGAGGRFVRGGRVGGARAAAGRPRDAPRRRGASPPRRPPVRARPPADRGRVRDARAARAAHRHSWWQFVRSSSNLMLKTRFLFEPASSSPTSHCCPSSSRRPRTPSARSSPNGSVVLVPVSGVHDAAVRAIVYAKSLRPGGGRGHLLLAPIRRTPTSSRAGTTAASTCR